MAKPRYYVQAGETADFDLPDKRYFAVMDRTTDLPKVYFYCHYHPIVKVGIPGILKDKDGNSYGAEKHANDECAILNQQEKANKARERKRKRELEKAIAWFSNTESADIAELFAESLPAVKATEIIDALIKALDRNAADLFGSTLRRPLAIRYMAQANVLAQIRREVDNAA